MRKEKYIEIEHQFVVEEVIVLTSHALQDSALFLSKLRGTDNLENSFTSFR